EAVFAPDQCWALRRGRAHVVDSPESAPLCKHLGTPPAGGYLCLPLVGQGAAMGILHLRDEPDRESPTSGPDRRREFRQRLAIGMAEHVALALGNLRLQEMLRNQVIRDPVTGLFNRRYMTESLEREVHRAIRNQTPLGIVMLDIDNFKPLNDRLGHDAGDGLLRALGCRAARGARSRKPTSTPRPEPVARGPAARGASSGRPPLAPPGPPGGSGRGGGRPSRGSPGRRGPRSLALGEFQDLGLRHR